MATNASAICKFSDGSISYLRNAVTLDARTELLTDSSGLVNQAGGLSVGQANQGKTLTHCQIKVQTDTATTGTFSYGVGIGVGGNVEFAIQGGSTQTSGLARLKRPVRMMTGMKIEVFCQALADAVQYGSLAVYCSSGKVDVFQGLAVDDTDVSMTSIISGSTIGESLVGEQCVCWYATYPATNGLADTGVADGVSAFFCEDAQGQLKSMMFANGGFSYSVPTQWVEDSFRISQNDTLTIRANV